MSQSASFTALQVPFVDPKTGRVTQVWLYVLQQWQTQLAKGFDSGGNLISNIEPTVGIVGRDGDVGSILQNIDENGIVLSAGMTSASDTEQGAVLLAAGSTGHTLGSAAMEPASAFDINGAAAAAQTAAEAHADAVAAAAQSNAEAFASNASNITSGNLALTQLPIAGLTVTITTAALTPTGTQGSMEFTNGVLTGQVQAT